MRFCGIKIIKLSNLTSLVLTKPYFGCIITIGRKILIPEGKNNEEQKT